ncbi:Txe/YoeB family addiction module toxin [Bacteroidetes/Chlorobi group bacterium ChocPot_Mid]|jgi:toxin YoeB|nr:MAG: Txe/YoeB family addiction module toxin [Bacteroidetes/Chlorobi group bacterium ChocPot_Mid]
MRKIRFEKIAFEQYNAWLKTDIKIYKKIAKIIVDIQKQPFLGIGKPEPLKHEFQGYWSRRITNEHRLVYKVTDDEIVIVSCKYHY